MIRLFILIILILFQDKVWPKTKTDFLVWLKLPPKNTSPGRTYRVTLSSHWTKCLAN